MSELNLEQQTEVRMICAAMIGQAMRDVAASLMRQQIAVVPVVTAGDLVRAAHADASTSAAATDASGNDSAALPLSERNQNNG